MLIFETYQSAQKRSNIMALAVSASVDRNGLVTTVDIGADLLQGLLLI